MCFCTQYKKKLNCYNSVFSNAKWITVKQTFAKSHQLNLTPRKKENGTFQSGIWAEYYLKVIALRSERKHNIFWYLS